MIGIQVAGVEIYNENILTCNTLEKLSLFFYKVS